MREIVAEFRKPAMLYSIGNDFAVMLHLAVKALLSGELPFSLMRKLREMISFRRPAGRAHRSRFDRLY